MATGVAFWIGNEIGHYSSMRDQFKDETNEALLHQKNYRQLYSMIKETKTPTVVCSSFNPKETGLLRFLENSECSEVIERRLDTVIAKVNQNLILDSH